MGGVPEVEWSVIKDTREVTVWRPTEKGLPQMSLVLYRLREESRTSCRLMFELELNQRACNSGSYVKANTGCE